MDIRCMKWIFFGQNGYSSYKMDIRPRNLMCYIGGLSRGWAEPEPKLCARIKILVFVWRLPEIPAFRLQLSGRKPEEHPFTFTFTLNFLNKYTGRIYSSCFLPDICNRNAGISCSPETKTRTSILAQSFGSGSSQPLYEIYTLTKHADLSSGLEIAIAPSGSRPKSVLNLFFKDWLCTRLRGLTMQATERCRNILPLLRLSSW